MKLYLLSFLLLLSTATFAQRKISLSSGGGSGGGGSAVLYSSTGANTDGAITQAASTSALNLKVNVTDTAAMFLNYRNAIATATGKLATIATGATANSTDAVLLGRANHTGVQAISTVTGLQTALDGKATAQSISDSLNATSIIFSQSDFYGAGTSWNNLRVKAKADSAATLAAIAAKQDALPSQTGNSGKVLGTDGTSPAWVAQSAGATTSLRTGRSSSSGNRYAVAYGARTVESGGGGGLSDGTQLIETSRLKYKAIGNLSDLSVVFINGNRSSQDAITATNSITITASIEYEYIAPNGTTTSNTLQQITFRGSASYILPRDKSITSDLITAEIPDGAYFWIRTCVTVTSGQKWYKNQATRTGYSEGATSGSDVTMSGTISNGTTYVFGPAAILGVSNTNKASIQWVGNSIASGSGDSGGTEFSFGTGRGIYGRAFMDNYPGIMHNRSGDSFADWLPRAHPHFSSFLGTTDLFVCELGVNDLSRTLAVNQVNAIAIWDAFLSRGVYGYQTTITPNTTSSDNWATVANQTVTANESRRTGFNDWVRDGAPIHKVTRAAQAVGTTGAMVTRAGQPGHPLLGYFEVADSVESSRNSGKFKTGPVTADGLHLNPAGYTLAAAAIDLTKFILW